jgi:hypothetical protein
MDNLSKTILDIAAPPVRATLRASAIKVGYLKSMLHMRHYYQAPPGDLAGMRFGRLVHMAVLEPHKKPAIWTGATRRGKEFDAWKADVPDGVEIVLPGEWQEAQDCAASILANEKAAELLDGTTREMLVVYDDSEIGKCAARLDAYKAGFVIDIKTTGQISERAFANTCARMAYHIQYGFYDWILTSKGFDPYRRECWSIVAEQDPPYDVACYQVDPFAVGFGKAKSIEVARRFRECELARRWPGQQAEAKTIELPEWVYSENAPEGIGDSLEL